MPSRQETFIQQLLEFVGRSFHGPGTLHEINISLNGHITVITLTALCAKSSDTEATTVANPKPSPSRPTSPNPLSSDSNQNTSRPSLLIFAGTHGLVTNSESLDILLALLAESGGSLEGEMILQPSGKPLHITLKDPSRT